MLTMGFLSWLFGDENLMSLLAQNWVLGVWIVAAIVFCETGLVVLPFLPGDGLLFATGALLGAQVSPPWPMGVITLAAILGDLLNYSIGRSALGQTLIRRGWVKPQHLAKTQAFSIVTARPPSPSAASCPSCARWRRFWPGYPACARAVSPATTCWAR